MGRLAFCEMKIVPARGAGRRQHSRLVHQRCLQCQTCQRIFKFPELVVAASATRSPAHSSDACVKMLTICGRDFCVPPATTSKLSWQNACHGCLPFTTPPSRQRTASFCFCRSWLEDRCVYLCIAVCVCVSLCVCVCASQSDCDEVCPAELAREF